MAKNFRELQAKMSPESRERVEAMMKQADEEMLLTELRKMMQLADPQIFANDPAIQQQIEAQDNLPLTMMYRMVQHLGGELQLVVKLPNQTIHFPPLKKSAKDAA